MSGAARGLVRARALPWNPPGGIGPRRADRCLLVGVRGKAPALASRIAHARPAPHALSHEPYVPRNPDPMPPPALQDRGDCPMLQRKASGFAQLDAGLTTEYGGASNRM